MALASTGLALIILIAAAATSDTVKVRGTIERTDGPIYVVKTRDGAELRVALADNAQVTEVVNASLADIKQGSFVVSRQYRRPTVVNARSRSIFFPRPYAGLARVIVLGTWRRPAP